MHTRLASLMLVLSTALGCYQLTGKTSADGGDAPLTDAADAGPDSDVRPVDAAPDAPDAADVIDDATDATDAGDAPDATDATEDVSDAADASDAADVSDATGVSDATDASDAGDVSDGMEVVDASDASDVVDATESAVDAADVVDVTCAPGQTPCGATCETLGATCMVGVGACARTGVMICGARGGTTCSATAGVTATEVCDGVDNDCDGLTDEGFCRIGGVCFADGDRNPANACQRCATSATASAPSAWSNTPTGTICRAPVGVCDVAESCDGTGAPCPSDGYLPTSVVCRAAAGLCDRAESCTGSAAACPVDGFVVAGTVCRASATAPACDPAEVCTGSSAACPADVVVRAPTTETCDGVDNNCDGIIDNGSAASSCVAPSNATSTCSSGACGFTCVAGYVPSGGACVRGSTAEVCNYFDDDGDGLVDEGFNYAEIPGSRVVRPGDLALWRWPIARGGDRLAFAYYNAGVQVEVLDALGAHVATSLRTTLSGVDFGGAGFGWLGDRFFFAGVTGTGLLNASGFSVLPDATIGSPVARLSADAPVIGGYLAVGAEYLLATASGRGSPVRLRSYLANGAAGSIDRTLIASTPSELVNSVLGAVIGSEIAWIYDVGLSTTPSDMELRMLVTRLDGAPLRGPFTLTRELGPPMSVAAIGSDVTVLFDTPLGSTPGAVVVRYNTTAPIIETRTRISTDYYGYANHAASANQLFWCGDSGPSGSPGYFGRLSATAAVVQPATSVFTDVAAQYRCAIAPADRGAILAQSNYSPSRIVWARVGCALPRQIAPLSTSMVSSRRPTLRWELPPDLDGARVQICRDRACAMVEQTVDATGTSGRPATDLSPGVHYWRLYGRNASAVGTATTPVWEFFVGRRATSTDTSWPGMSDLNGDGISDLAIGAPSAMTSGRTYIYPGTATGPLSSSVLTLNCAPPVALGDVNGDGLGDLGCVTRGAGGSGALSVYLGAAPVITPTASASIGFTSGLDVYLRSITAAGDLNGDGYGDLAVGLRSPSRVVIYFGSAAGLDASSSRVLTGFDPSARATQLVPASGDINGDGYTDLLVGTTEGSAGPGHVYVWSGRASGLLDAPSITLTGTDGAGTHCDGAPYTFGAALTANGDLNGDGFGDLLVGAPGRRGDGTGGRVYLFTGSTTGLTTTPSVTVSPAGTYTFGSNVVYLGDSDGDGFDDLAVDDQCYITDNNGRVYVHRGGTGGLNPTADVTITGPSGSNLGRSLAGPADLNGDGYGDLAAGAPRYPTYGDRGRVMIFLGGASGIPSSATTTRDAPDGGGFGTWIARASRRRALRAVTAR